MDSAIANGAANLLQLVERSAFIGFWRMDCRGRTLAWSDQLVRMHGLAPGDAPGFDHALAHFVEEHRPLLQARLRACHEDGVPFDLEVQIAGAQGRRVWVRCVGQPLCNAQGERIGVVGLVQEIAPAG